MYTDKVFTCNITTWVGTSFNAIHFYGKMEDGIDLTYLLTEYQVAELNKKDSEGFIPGICSYSPGDECNRYDSLEEVRNSAIQYLQEKYKDKYDFLIEGDRGACPQFIIWAKDKKIKDQLNRIYKEYEKANDKKCYELIYKWERLAFKYNIININPDEN